jgi:hypothetical protein
MQHSELSNIVNNCYNQIFNKTDDHHTSVNISVGMNTVDSPSNTTSNDNYSTYSSSGNQVTLF